jgi:phage baseplate assembly protein W
MVSGRAALGQAIGRRLQTPRGTLVDDRDYGFDLLGSLNDDLSASDLGKLQSAIDDECLKDPRVIAATSTVTVSGSSGALTLTATIVLTDTVGPFKFVVSVSDLGFALSA